MSAREPNLSPLGHVKVELHLPDEDVAVPRSLGLLGARYDVKNGGAVLRYVHVEHTPGGFHAPFAPTFGPGCSVPVGAVACIAGQAG